MNFRTDYAELEKRLAKQAAKVEKAKLKPEQSAKTKTTTNKVSIANKRVVVTGSIPGMSRTQVANFLARFGAVMETAVSGRTHYLIVGNTRGSNTTKMQAAQMLGVSVLQYSQVQEFK